MRTKNQIEEAIAKYNHELTQALKAGDKKKILEMYDHVPFEDSEWIYCDESIMSTYDDLIDEVNEFLYS